MFAGFNCNMKTGFGEGCYTRAYDSEMHTDHGLQTEGVHLNLECACLPVELKIKWILLQLFFPPELDDSRGIGGMLWGPFPFTAK